MRSRTAKVYYLDGIRGIAALAVLAHHLFLCFLPAFYSLAPDDGHMRDNREILVGGSVFSVFANGTFAVCVFFVLSGYVLSRQYFLTGNVETVVSAAIRRYIRLYIPVAVTLIIAYAMLKAGWFYNLSAGSLTHSEWWMGAFWVTDDPEGKLVSGLTYSTMFLGDSLLDSSLWTISIELFGSMLVFAFLVLTHNARNKGILLAVLVAYFLGFRQFYYAGFLMGIGLHFTKHWELRSGVWQTVVSTLVFMLSLFIGAYPLPKGWLPEWSVLSEYELTALYHTVGSVLLIVSVLMSPRLQLFFGSRIIRFFGRISFCLYLIHVLIICSLGCFLLLKLHPLIGYTRAAAVGALASVAVTIMAAHFMTEVVDERGVMLSKYVYGKWFRGKDGTTPA